ncbi:MAG: PilN domain-containing protein [Halanaerobiaceae bacterium]|nr:PilN domain-containing protein [Halanaerobiaceae bacterium]
MRVNLLKERMKDITINWIEIATVIGVIFFVIALVCHYYFFLLAKANALDSEIRSLNNQINTLLVKVQEYNALKAKVDRLEEIKAKMDKLQYIWLDVVMEQGYVSPSNLMLERMDIQNNILSLTGLAANNQKVLDLINNMKLSPMYDEIKIIRVTQDEDSAFDLEAVIATETDEPAGEGDNYVQ